MRQISKDVPPLAAGRDAQPPAGKGAQIAHKLSKWLEIGLFTAALAASCSVFCDKVGSRRAEGGAGEQRALAEIREVRGKIRSWAAAETFCGTGGLAPLSDEFLRQDHLSRGDTSEVVRRERSSLISELSREISEVERMRSLRKGHCPGDSRRGAD